MVPGHSLAFEISLYILQTLEEYGLVVAPGYLTPQMLEAAREVADLDDETLNAVYVAMLREA